MTQSLKQIARRGIFPRLGLNGKPTLSPLQGGMNVPGELAFTGPKVEQMTSDIEEGLLARDAVKVSNGLDALVHLIEMQIERLVDVEIPDKGLSWRTAVLRLAAARANHAILRVPAFTDHLGQSSAAPITLPHRMLAALAFFADMTRQHIVEDNAALTPDHWLKMPPTYTQMRVNLGVAYYHLSRVLEAGGYADLVALQERDTTFAHNFDIMFYALTYGPLEPTTQTVTDHALLQRHFEMVTSFLDSPQPAIRDDPERFAVPEAHVLHIMTTVDRVQEILPRLTA